MHSRTRPTDLSPSADHYTQYLKWRVPYGCDGIDAYESNGPALGKNGQYGTFTHTQRAVDILSKHDASVPLFLYMALQVMHAPQQVPNRFSDLYKSRSSFSHDCV